MRNIRIVMAFAVFFFSISSITLRAESVQETEYEIDGSIYNLLDVRDVYRLITDYPDMIQIDEDMIIPRMPRVVIIADGGGGECYDSLSAFNLGSCAVYNKSVLQNFYSSIVNRCFAANQSYTAIVSYLSCASYGYYNTALEFAKYVYPKGLWDYKKLFSSYDVKVNVRINGTFYTLTAEALGNIHYGYVGSVMFSEQTLKTAAGLIHLTQNYKNIASWLNLGSYFDDPNDQLAIQRGINWYHNGYFR